MRVAIFCNDYYPTIGGVQTAVRGIAAGLHKRGHEVLVVTQQPGGSPASERVDAAEVRRFSWTLRPLHSFPLRWWRAKRAVSRMLAAWKPDVVYVHFVSTHALYARIASRRVGVPMILSFRGNDAMRIASRNAVSERVFAHLTEDADVILFSSVWLAEHMKAARWLRSRTGRLGVLADAVDVSHAEPAPQGERYVLAGGRFVHKKGFDLLLSAWSMVDGQIDAPLWLAGDGPERTALEALAASLSLNGRVKFLGPVPHQRMLGLVAGSTMCVVPSREEPYGIIVVEAQALGTPVVACAVGNIPMLIQPRVTGFLAEPKAESLAATLVEAWNAGALSEIAAAGRESLGANRSYDTMTAELEDWIALAREEVS